jgi:hypothetical protein
MGLHTNEHVGEFEVRVGALRFEGRDRVEHTRFSPALRPPTQHFLGRVQRAYRIPRRPHPAR